MNTKWNIMLRFIALITVTLAPAPAVAQTLDRVEYDIDGSLLMDASTWPNTMEELKVMGASYIATPMRMLVTLESGEIFHSELAIQAKAADIKIITWTIERSGPLVNGGGRYYQSIADAVNSDGVKYELIDALAQDVGVEGIFSDWPATATYSANCMGLE
jgi:glycerophosphoryl diester phosphodiesterase